jgi:RNA polymerase sigma-70 factor (ECF subfamily)
MWLSMNGLSNKEIVEDLSISINTVKTTKRRAFEKIRQEIKKYF